LGEAEGRQKADEDDRQCRYSAEGVPRRAGDGPGREIKGRSGIDGNLERYAVEWYWRRLPPSPLEVRQNNERSIMSAGSIHFTNFDHFDAQIEIPMNLSSLEAFRAWITSDNAPEKGRIEYINGRIEVNMSPEDLYTHGTLKGEIHGILHRLVKSSRLGHLFIDSTRISCPGANLSVEPDIVYVSKASLADGRIREIPKAGSLDRYVEYEGPPDLIVEVIGDSSLRKDTKRLPLSYFDAGVPEYWLADARREELRFQINRRGEGAYTETPFDADGYQFSEVLQHRFKLVRERDETDTWEYDLLSEAV
jgi:Uma2 family endonuclease